METSLSAMVLALAGEMGTRVLALFGVAAIVLYGLSERSRSLESKLVVLTGAGTGLGRALAFALARERCRLVAWDTDAEALHKTVADIEATVPGAKVFPYKINLVDREAIYDVASRVRQEHGPIWGLINNAEIIAGQTLIEEPDKKIETVMNVNIMAHFWTCKAFLPDMLNFNDGHIVAVSGVVGLFPSARMVSYCASKHAVRGLIEALQIELRALGKDGVKATVAYSAHIQTELFKGYSIRTTTSPEYAASQIVNGLKRNRGTIFLS